MQIVLHQAPAPRLAGRHHSSCPAPPGPASAFVSADPPSETTLDAYVTADFTLVAPKVAGLVQSVTVEEDNQAVKAGRSLATIDDRDFRAALDSAGADVEAARGQVANLDAEIARQPALVAQAAAVVPLQCRR